MTVNFSKKSFLTKRRGNRKPGRAYGFPSPARAPLWPTAAAGSLCSARMGLRDPGQQRWWGWRWEPWRGLREVGGAWGGAGAGPAPAGEGGQRGIALLGGFWLSL